MWFPTMCTMQNLTYQETLTMPKLVFGIGCLQILIIKALQGIWMKRNMESWNIFYQIHSYKNYQKWGTLATPLYTFGLWAINWAFWISVFYAIGGSVLVCSTFSGTMFWYILVRAFNYTGHGKGKVAHKDGIDFDMRNLSINQTRSGLFSGEWHNNHHLYPGSARAGFLPYQIDTTWIYIYCLSK